MTRTPDAPAPFWLYYFNVEAIDAAIARVAQGGGKVANGPHAGARRQLDRAVPRPAGRDVRDGGAAALIAFAAERGWPAAAGRPKPASVRTGSQHTRICKLKRWLVTQMQATADRLGYSIAPKWRLQNLALAGHLRSLFRAYGIDAVIDIGANEGGFGRFLRLEVGFTGRVFHSSRRPPRSRSCRRRPATIRRGRSTIWHSAKPPGRRP